MPGVVKLPPATIAFLPPVLGALFNDDLLFVFVTGVLLSIAAELSLVDRSLPLTTAWLPGDEELITVLPPVVFDDDRSDFTLSRFVFLGSVLFKSEDDVAPDKLSLLLVLIRFVDWVLLLIIVVVVFFLWLLFFSSFLWLVK